MRTRARAIDYYGKKRSYPRSLNDNGLAVGTLNFGTAAVFFGRRPEKLFDQLTPQSTWKSLDFAADVNNQGRIVGSGTLTVGGNRGFIYQNGVATVLTGLAPDSNTGAAAINEAGAVVGTSSVPGSGSASHAVIFVPGAPTQDLDGPGHRRQGVDLNNRGVAVSYALRDDGRTRSYVHWDGVTADLGVLAGYRAMTATAINEDNDVVGTAHQGRKKRDHGFLYRGNRLHDLNDLVGNRGRYTIARADGINDKGVIAATAYDAKAKKYIAVRLDPVK